MSFRKIPPLEFQGYRDDLPVRRYQRYLPHWRQQGATYFVTFHLNDTLPAVAREALRITRERFDREHPPPHNDEQLLERANRLARMEERWLDKGHGACPFTDKKSRKFLREALHYFNEDEADAARYALGAYVLMPNHVHILVRPLNDETHPLEAMTWSWKNWSARKLNKWDGKRGSRWFSESYDRIVRDTEELWRCLQYIGTNGGLAGLEEDQYERWVCPTWAEAGWDFEP